MLNIDKIRNDTSSCSDLIHFNNAGCSLMPDKSVEKYISYIKLENAIGGYEAAESKSEEINQIYSNIATLINSSHDEIFLCKNSTEGWQLVLLALNWKAGDEILLDHSEYASNYLFFLKLQKEKLIQLKFIKQDSLGKICLQDLESKITAKTKLISLVHIATSNGQLNRAEEVGEISKKHGVLYLLDACQSAGQYPLNVQKLQCDIMTTSARKYLRGPRGIGFTFIKKEIHSQLSPPFIDLHSANWLDKDVYLIRNDAQFFETWERNIAAQLAFNESIKYALSTGMQLIWKRVCQLSKYLRIKLSTINDINIREELDSLTGITTLNGPSIDLVDIKRSLREQSINTSITKTQNARLDLQQNMLRVSLHYYNTEDEIDSFIGILKKSLHS